MLFIVDVYAKEHIFWHNSKSGHGGIPLIPHLPHVFSFVPILLPFGQPLLAVDRWQHPKVSECPVKAILFHFYLLIYI